PEERSKASGAPPELGNCLFIYQALPGLANIEGSFGAKTIMAGAKYCELFGVAQASLAPLILSAKPLRFFANSCLYLFNQREAQPFASGSVGSANFASSFLMHVSKSAILTGWTLFA
ncbi:MAG TPA: hypothetical protein PLN21_21860, partial [Gemmatales bacterium]|nr:hypothetical protein [Gemmatales bacterium]